MMMMMMIDDNDDDDDGDMKTKNIKMGMMLFFFLRCLMMPSVATKYRVRRWVR
jgi:hypothetical protein